MGQRTIEDMRNFIHAPSEIRKMEFSTLMDHNESGAHDEESARLLEHEFQMKRTYFNAKL